MDVQMKIFATHVQSAHGKPGKNNCLHDRPRPLSFQLDAPSLPPLHRDLQSSDSASTWRYPPNLLFSSDLHPVALHHRGHWALNSVGSPKWYAFSSFLTASGS